MINTKMMFCAEGIIIDKRTNNISAFNVFEEFSGNAFPVFVPKIQVLVYSTIDESDPTEYECQLQVSLSGTVLTSAPVKLNFLNKKKNRLIVTFGGLAIPKPGALDFKFICGGNVTNIYTIDVSQKTGTNIEIERSEEA